MSQYQTEHSVQSSLLLIVKMSNSRVELEPVGLNLYLLGKNVSVSEETDQLSLTHSCCSQCKREERVTLTEKEWNETIRLGGGRTWQR